MCILASVFCGSSPSILQQTREETSLAGFPTVIMNKNLSLIQGLRKWQQPPKILQFLSSWDYLVKTGKLEVLFHISESTKCYQQQRRVLGLLANYQVYDNEHHFLPKNQERGWFWYNSIFTIIPHDFLVPFPFNDQNDIFLCYNTDTKNRQTK